MNRAIPFLCAAALLTAPARAASPERALAPTPEEALAFVASAEKRLLALTVEASQAGWVQANFITRDTEALSALANERLITATAELAKQAERYRGLALPPDAARKLEKIRLSLDLAAPADPRKSAELTRLATGLDGAYGRGRACLDGTKDCLTFEEVNRRMAESRDPKELLALWKGWHAVGAPLRAEYRRFVTLGNEGARELGFADTGAMWRSKYDMTPDAFAREVDRLWEQVRPLYVALHAYTRRRLRERYGDAVPATGPIPAHLLGNMWAQDWTNVYPLLAPKNADPGFDLTKILETRRVDAQGMMKYGEAFFTSLGFAPLPKTFWERSLLTRPRDRDVVCHASAWDIDLENDIRIKMCTEPTAEDFVTVHHELGHNFYQRAYAKQPPLFRDSANDGFHEAIGDTVALSITPKYLRQLGFIATEPPASADIGFLLNRALEKVAFLPFGVLIDQWRWKVFSGEVPPERYNAAWWELKRKYQGVAPPEPRSEADFDPGAKYHVPSNTPYMRYFLAHVLEFQFHRALAQAAGCTGPLHRCSIYGNKEAGRRLAEVLDMGSSRPWPEALEKLTGQRQIDATAILDYFAPLKKWLDEQNAGQPSGW
ncbi:MAG: M2 family metallopeptidase [Thermoanaerobaculia bacterium]